MSLEELLKQLGPIDITSIIPNYTVDYKEDGIPLEISLDVTPIPLTTSDNIDYTYLLYTIHTDDEDNNLYKIVKIKIIDTDTAIIVGYI